MRRAVPFLAVVLAAASLPLAAAADAGAVPTCRGREATLVGTGDDDLLVGTGGDDVIVARRGNDTIRGLGGNDIVCGGPGDDDIHGGGGDDQILGGGGNDLLKGGDGNDELLGNSGADTLWGWKGADVLDGGAGDDVLLGHAGDDLLAGGYRDDVLDGGNGADAADGGPGVDECDDETMESCELVHLREGDTGPAVRFLQTALRDGRLYRGPIDGVFDAEVAVSVATYHKVTGPAYSNPYTAVTQWKASPPSERMTPADTRALLAFEPVPPKSRTRQPDRVEIDIGHQVLYLILDDRVDAIVHVSTGTDPHKTPRTTHLPDGGYFWYKHPYNGWSPKPGAWSIYKFWAYRAGSEYNYGVHGYRDVPYWPASHGCTRVHVWEADYLHELFFIGMPVHAWDA